MSCTGVFAEPMLEDENFLNDYKEELQTLREQGVLPADLKKKMTFKVFSIEGSGCGKHRSIVLTTDDNNFFTVELGFITVDGTKRIYPVSVKLEPSLRDELSYHGRVKMSTDELFSKAIKTMKKFGNYFKLGNNCQDFCNKYLESIGLGETTKPTDSDKTALLLSSAALGGFLVYLFS